jgi:chemotaxis protein CheX
MAVLSRDALSDVVCHHTWRVCETMLNLSVQLLDQDHGMAPVPGAAVVSLIGLTGTWSGTGAVVCSGALACRLSGRLLMTEFDAVDPEVLDAMGEIANMIIGNVKDDVMPTLGPLAISTPTVIHGEGLQTRSVEGQTEARLVFACDGDVLEVRVSLVPSRRAA